jgi:hypothetical protein
LAVDSVVRHPLRDGRGYLVALSSGDQPGPRPLGAFAWADVIVIERPGAFPDAGLRLNPLQTVIHPGLDALDARGLLTHRTNRGSG